MAEVTKLDKVIYRVGYAGILIAAFAWGWNATHFKFKKS